jgi:LytS/YehU family sensor histidine kinase
MGVVVPAVSGLVDHARHGWIGLVASYAYFSALAFVVWEGNRRVYYKLSRREDWLERPWYRAALLMTVIVAFTIPVSVVLLVAWQRVTGDPGVRPYAMPTAVVGIVAIAAVITNVYETVFLVRGWESARLRSARAESARLTAELDRLTREVDPHFLFNNLHALQHLVERNDPRAVPFLEALSDTYRYVLASREQALVPLEQELQALERHYTLAATRYGGCVHVRIDIVADDARGLSVPPVSLGELLQNALKHNVVNAEHPLTFVVKLEGDTVIVSNPVRRRSQPAASTGVGLTNLSERVRLAVGRPMTWDDHGGRFVVRMPAART